MTSKEINRFFSDRKLDYTYPETTGKKPNRCDCCGRKNNGTNYCGQGEDPTTKETVLYDICQRCVNREGKDTMRFPSIKSVASDLSGCKSYLEKGADMDIRLQVYGDGDWAIRTGDSSYDLDHRGYWGCSIIDRRSNCRDLAIDLLEQVKDYYYQTPEDAREMELSR